MSVLTQSVEALHERAVTKRRVRVLADHVRQLIPDDCHSIADVGCGDGEISRAVVSGRNDLSVVGVDVLQRPNAAVPVELYDGVNLPFAGQSQDIVMFVDVLHHAEHPIELLRDAVRVCNKAIIIKDHLCEGKWSATKLRFMDQVGNRRFGVSLTYDYWSHHQWMNAFQDLDLNVDRWETDLDLYAWPVNLVFEQNLHFVTLLKPSAVHGSYE